MKAPERCGRGERLQKQQTILDRREIEDTYILLEVQKEQGDHGSPACVLNNLLHGFLLP